MDRAGIVGPDGPTHHGVFDISMLNILPNIVIAAPKDGDELYNLLYTAVELRKPFAIRYPKETTLNFNIDRPPVILPIGSWEYIWNNPNSEVTILATGSMVNMIIEGEGELKDSIGCSITFINCRFIKPLDIEKLKSILDNNNNVVTIEEGSSIGGFGSMVENYFINSSIKVLSMGIPDNYIEHGSRDELLNDIDLNIKGVVKSIKAIVNE